jgi:hypothetical protein
MGPYKDPQIIVLWPIVGEDVVVVDIIGCAVTASHRICA